MALSDIVADNPILHLASNLMPTTRINGVDIYYEEHGSGFPLVFCHEFAGDYRSWNPQVNSFARTYRCITWNYRGYPPSGVPSDAAAYSQDQLIEDLRGLLGHLDIEQAHLVGLSMGGNVVLNFAFTYPELCRSIVVSGMGAGTTHREQFERDGHHVVDSLRAQGMQALADVYTKGPSRLPFLRKDPLGWQEFAGHFAEHSAVGSAFTQLGVQLSRPNVFDQHHQLKALTVPTLVLIGDEDEPCVDAAVFMKREIPTAGLVVIPQTGHTVNLEEPVLFNQAVALFLQAVEHDAWAARHEVSTSLLPPGTRT